MPAIYDQQKYFFNKLETKKNMTQVSLYVCKKIIIL